MRGAIRRPGSHPPARAGGARLALALGLALLVPVCAAMPAAGAPADADADAPTGPPAVPVPAALRLADFMAEPASPEARRIAHWALHSGDHGGMPYVVVDKAHARVFVFDAQGRLQGAGPALLGMQRGDGTAAGLGDRALSAITPQERTTPAGRFVAALGLDPAGVDILWIDYDSALALHRIARGTPAERRAERLLSASADDNRISYGCINVAVPFYDTVVRPAFRRSSGVVYILPETGPASALFGAYDVEATGAATGDASRAGPDQR